MLDLQPWREERLLAGEAWPAACRRVEISGSVVDAACTEAAVKGCSDVFHLAAKIDWGQGDPAEVRAVNVGGTASLVWSGGGSC